MGVWLRAAYGSSPCVQVKAYLLEGALALAGSFRYSVPGPLRGEALEGVSAMTEKEAGEIAHGLVQGFIGPDHRVMDMQSFYRALSQALQKANQQGWPGSRRG
jgi:hypothetical protein